MWGKNIVEGGGEIWWGGGGENITYLNILITFINKVLGVLGVLGGA